MLKNEPINSDCLEKVERKRGWRIWWEVFTVKKPKGNTVNLGGGELCSEAGWGSYSERWMRKGRGEWK